MEMNWSKADSSCDYNARLPPEISDTLYEMYFEQMSHLLDSKPKYIWQILDLHKSITDKMFSGNAMDAPRLH